MTLQTVSELNTAPIRHGRKYEPVAIAAYEKLYKVRVLPSGIVVHGCYPYLGTSPDGIFDHNLIVEIKCPYINRFQLIDHGSVPYFIQTDHGFELSRSHDYYYQIQGQLAICNKKLCHLAVYHSGSRDLKVVSVSRNDNFIREMMANCMNSIMTISKKNFSKNTSTSKLMSIFLKSVEHFISEVSKILYTCFLCMKYL